MRPRASTRGSRRASTWLHPGSIRPGTKHRSAGPTRRRGQDQCKTGPPWPDFRGWPRSPRARGDTARVQLTPSSQARSGTRAPLRRWGMDRKDAALAACKTLAKPAQARARLAQLKRCTEQSKMHKTRATAALLCIAATNAFVAPTRSVARPSSSHAQPTAPAAMRQQTYACSARIKTSRHVSNDARTPRRRRRRPDGAAPDSLVDAQATKHGYPWRFCGGSELCGN